ncbi:24240_t:CDS:1 [Cetraspora pellucida]|uniref:24240_t:CDS:1 n=1 Tax=Cetraspora pellucida TaxID=1433469 RepID=A0A9N9EZE4_9GLOM|nr:24240_t:CDS:1 [Cetraspora pellucida]
MPKRTTLTDNQKFEFCVYAHDNKRTCPEYVKWIENKWRVKVNKSIITRILQTKDQRLSNEIINPEAKRHRTVTVLELELMLKEFILIYQHCTILSNAIIIEKAKLLVDKLGVPEGKLHFSSGWLQKFKEQNRICQIKLYREAGSDDEDVIIESLPLLQSKCSEYSLDHIYNMDETELFY